MTDPIVRPSSILVDVELPDPGPLSPKIVDALAPLHVVLLGWYAVPEQTSPEQARDQFGDDAQAALDDVTRRLEGAGAEVTSRLVFTGDRFETLTRISTEEDCDAVLIPAPLDYLERVVVPLRGISNVERIVSFVADLVQDRDIEVVLLHVLTPDPHPRGRARILDATSSILVEQGVDQGQIERKTLQSEDPAQVIVDEVGPSDLIVLGETEPTIREIVFGSVAENVIRRVDGPVVVVRHQSEEVEQAERAMEAGT